MAAPTNTGTDLAQRRGSVSKDGTAEAADKALAAALQRHGQRLTRQRAAVHRALAATRSHPTAEEVFRTVRIELPEISLATVYSNLEVLVRCGLAIRLALTDGSARYDGQMEPHLHGRCDACGGVFDFHGSSEADVLASLSNDGSALARATSFRVTGIRLELTGRCEDCDA